MKSFLTILIAAFLLATTSPPTQNLLVAQTNAVARAPVFPRYDRVLMLETVSETSANVSIGDLNGDGQLDLLVVKGRHWPLKSRIFLGNGRGQVVSAYNLSETAYRSYSGRLVDIDGDRDLDIVLSSDTPDPKVIYLNDGKGHFRRGSSFGRAAWETRNVGVADLNRDGRPDVIVANRASEVGKGANYICLNHGRGRFDADCIAFSKEPATTITPADFNNDKLIDLAVPHREAGQSYVYLAGPRATFSNLKRVPFGPPDARIRIAQATDLNRDGFLDIVAIDEKRGVAIYFGQKEGTFSAGLAIDTGNPIEDGKVSPYALLVSDLNRDGKIDIIVGNVEAPSTVYFNDGSGRHYRTVHFGDNQGTVYGFAVADLDGNGLPDIAAARSDAPSLVYLADRPPSKPR